MLEMLMQWYRRRFSDPEAIALLVILLAGFGIMFFFSGLLAVAGGYRAGLSAGVADRSSGAHRSVAHTGHLAGADPLCGHPAVAGLCGAAGSGSKGIYLIRDMPGMLNKLSDFAATLPRRYPALMDAGIIDAMAENMRTRMLTVGDSVVKYSLASLVGLLTWRSIWCWCR